VLPIRLVRHGARSIALALAVVLVSAGCFGGGTVSSTLGTVGASITPLKVGLGFRPDVQFAAYYLAEQAGYYRDANLEVTFQHADDPTLITLVGQGAIDIGNADGTSVIPAVSQGIPLRYVFTVYAQYPSVVFSKAAAGIDEPADLEGKRVGTPFKGGSSWIMLQALLASANLETDDIDVRTYPDFGQRVAVEQDQVDAATGFANNEPLRMERAGAKVNVLRVDEVTPLPGPGLITAEATIAAKTPALRAFIAATRRAMEEIAADPENGLEAAIEKVPEIANDRETQLAILEATVETWQSPYTREHGLGSIDEAAWTKSIDFMRTLPGGPVPNPVVATDMISEDLLDE
jgi:NitT/TauT family transport system substrate-binding protein